MFSDLIIDFGLTRNELRNILDPKDIYGPDFPGENFRVLKEKEEKHYGEYLIEDDGRDCFMDVAYLVGCSPERIQAGPDS